MPVYAYVRVSTGRQDHENQRFEILKFADQRKWIIEEWCEETVSGTKRYTDRLLGPLLDRLQKGDTLVVTEISRLGRSLMEIMTILNLLLEREIQVFTCKEQFELGDNINSKVLAFAFGLAAEIERELISQRTKESLARLKAAGRKLGRPKGSLGKSKLDAHEDTICDYIGKGVSKASIGKILGVHPSTVTRFLKSRKMTDPPR